MEIGKQTTAQDMMDKTQLRFLIATLDNQDKPAILDHLKRLDVNDRYMRFFAAVSDSVLERYVSDVIDLNREKSFGIFAEDRQTLVAFAHVSGEERHGQGKRAELGISVDKAYRGKGFARRLMDRIMVYCKARNIHTLYMSCLRENKTMQHLARKAGLRVVLDHEEALAEVKLSDFPMEKIVSVSHEIAYEQIAIVDKIYRRNTELVNALLKGM
jgi:RimJ/RimL family protein N-acetyltransferase